MFDQAINFAEKRALLSDTCAPKVIDEMNDDLRHAFRLRTSGIYSGDSTDSGAHSAPILMIAIRVVPILGAYSGTEYLFWDRFWLCRRLCLFCRIRCHGHFKTPLESINQLRR